MHLTNLRKEFLDKLTDDQLTELAGIWATVGFDENANTC